MDSAFHSTMPLMIENHVTEKESRENEEHKVVNHGGNSSLFFPVFFINHKHVLYNNINR